MAGRGFLKSRLAQLKKQQEEEELLKQAELTKQLELSKQLDLSKQLELSKQVESLKQQQLLTLPKELQVPSIPLESPKPQEPEPPKPQEPSKPQELSKPENENISNVSIPITSKHLLAVNQPVGRGRRALIARYAQLSESTNLGSTKTIESTFSSMAVEDKHDIKNQSVTAVCKADSEVPKLLTPAIQPENVEKPVEEKSPVVNRVLRNPIKDSYHMTQLSSNYIPISIEENIGIFEYRVDYNPTIDVKSTRFFLLNQHRDKLPVKTFDGTALYVPKMLPDKITVLVGKLNDESEVKINISFKRKFALRECIHFYNVFLRSIMKMLGLVEFGRSCYDQNQKKLVPEFKLEVWPGYVTSIDEYEGGLHLCCEVSHRVLRLESVLQLMTNIMSKNEGGDTKNQMLASLLGSTVITQYNNKTYRIDDIDFTMTPLSTFEKNGNQVSFVDYYKQMYNINITNFKQPMLITIPKRKDITKKDATEGSNICCLVPELCNLTGLSETMKSDFKLMKALHVHTLVTPELRQQSIIDFVNRINENEKTSKKFKDWGLKISPIPVKLEGPVYKRETILLGNNIRKQVGANMDWGMDVAKSAMFVAVNLSNWAILYCTKDEPTAKSFCKQLVMCGRPLGMEINSPKPIKLNGVSPEVFANSVNNVVMNSSELQLVVVIFPNLREDRYNAIKRICCAELGVPSQVIISRTLSRPDKLQSITQKIALQINCKLGGSCWAIDIPLKNTMIVGIDVYHEKGKQMSSVVGFVASMDKTFTQWYSVAGMQKSTHQELMKSIQDAFYKVAHQFKAINGQLPDKIIIYRDGVSDGDLKHVEDVELFDLEESFKNYPGNYCPKVTCVIVQKRINTRVFQFLNNKYSNPSPGTVIDNTVTRRNYFDFFLVSQQVRQGTVNPTHYIVLKNGCNLSTENVQRLSYKLCHLYYNWCGTVKVPAPVQYAHKLAYLIGQNVRQMPNENLCNTLFFL